MGHPYCVVTFEVLNFFSLIGLAQCKWNDISQFFTLDQIVANHQD
jgi:hypothetical protein